MKIVLFLFISQVTASALLVMRTRECWQTCQQLMDRQFLRVLIPLVVSCTEALEMEDGRGRVRQHHLLPKMRQC